MAKKLSKMSEADFQKSDCVHLFFGVSTALIISEPLVPGSLTYSSFGEGAWGISEAWALYFLESTSTFFNTGV
jgi:hypothetical protein